MSNTVELSSEASCVASMKDASEISLRGLEGMVKKKEAARIFHCLRGNASDLGWINKL